MRQRILLGNQIHQAEWLASTAAGQAHLSTCLQGARPRCACRPGGVPMYVGRRGATLYLARMPGSGFLHAPSCPSHEEETCLSGMPAYPDGLIAESCDGGALSIQTLDLSRAITGAVPAVRIEGVLDLLIEQAGLNKWMPEAEPRKWGWVRSQLISASDSLMVGGQSLRHRVLIPDSFERDISDAIHAEAAAFINQGTGDVMICAPLREIQEAPYGYRIVLKHLPYLKLWLSGSHAAELAARYGRDIFSSPPRYALCLVTAHEGRKSGNYNIGNLAIRETDSQYLPCGSELEAARAESLRAERCEFVRPLRFDAPRSWPLADFAAFRDGRCVPLVCAGETGDEIIDAGRRSLGAFLERHGVA